MSNPFATAEAWDVPGLLLPPGQHSVTIREVDGSTTSSGGFPQLIVTVGNLDGELRDWIVVKPETIGKVNQLTDAAGLDRPTDEQVKADGQGYRLHPRYLAQLIGKKVDIVVREEPDMKDPEKMRTRMQGYLPAGRLVRGGDGNGASPATFPAAVPESDIPFAPSVL